MFLLSTLTSLPPIVSLYLHSLTHVHVTSRHSTALRCVALKGYPRGGRELLGPLSSVFGAAETWQWFTSHGVALVTEADGRVISLSLSICLSLSLSHSPHLYLSLSLSLSLSISLSLTLHISISISLSLSLSPLFSFFHTYSLSMFVCGCESFFLVLNSFVL